VAAEDPPFGVGISAGLSDPDRFACTHDRILAAGGFLATYVLERMLYHLNLTAQLRGTPGNLIRSRQMLKGITRSAFPGRCLRTMRCWWNLDDGF